MTQTKTYSLWQRLSAGAALFLFFITENFSLGFISPVYAGEIPAIASSRIMEDVRRIQIPESLGRVEEAFQGKPGRTVVVIRDAHSIAEAQKSVHRLIHYFETEYGVDKVGLEGASSRLDAGFLRSFPDQERLKKVLKDYVLQGELSGGTAAAIFSKNPQTVFQGVEDRKLYEEGLRLYRKAAEKKDALLEKLEGPRLELEENKKKIYSSGLLEVDRALRGFYQGKKDLSVVLRKLAVVQRPEDGTDLAAVLEEIERGEDDPSFGDGEVRKIAQQVLKHTAGAQTPVSGEKLKKLNAKFQKFQTGQLSAPAFALFLQEFLSQHVSAELFLAERLMLRNLSGQQKKLRDIEGTSFFNEFESYAGSVKTALMTNDAQRRLDSQSRILDLYEKLARLELTQPEWEEVKSLQPVESTKDLRPDISGRQNAWDSLETFRFAGGEDFKASRDFYSNAESRDAAFFHNLSKLTDGGPGSAILVAGGFHAQGITGHLKERGISYLLVMPEIKQIPAETQYQAHMRGEVSWRDYFGVENGQVNLYQAFVRAVRDKLLAAGSEHPAKKTLVSGSTADLRTLKIWRDQIIRDLAASGRLESAGEYTRFLDEKVKGKPEPNPPSGETLERLSRFITSLRQLKETGDVTPRNILGILKPSNTIPPVEGPMLLGTHETIDARVLGLTAGNFLRSETRSAESPDLGSVPQEIPAPAGVIKQYQKLSDEETYQLAQEVWQAIKTDEETADFDLPQVFEKQKSRRSVETLFSVAGEKDIEIVVRHVGPLVFVIAEKITEKGMSRLQRRLSGVFEKAPGNVILTERAVYLKDRVDLGYFTTHMIAAMLNQSEMFQNAVVSDFGAGQGVLAQVAFVLGARHVMLSDYSPEPLKLAARLLESQGAFADDSREPGKGTFSLHVMDFLDDEAEEKMAVLLNRADVVLANIGPWTEYLGVNDAVLRVIARHPHWKLMLNSGYRKDLHFEKLNEGMDLFPKDRFRAGILNYSGRSGLSYILSAETRDASREAHAELEGLSPESGAGQNLQPSAREAARSEVRGALKWAKLQPSFAIVSEEERQRLEKAAVQLADKIYAMPDRPKKVLTMPGSGLWAGQVLQAAWNALYPGEPLEFYHVGNGDWVNNKKALASSGESLLVLDDAGKTLRALNQIRPELELEFGRDRLAYAVLYAGKFPSDPEGFYEASGFSKNSVAEIRAGFPFLFEGRFLYGEHVDEQVLDQGLPLWHLIRKLGKTGLKNKVLLDVIGTASYAELFTSVTQARQNALDGMADNEVDAAYLQKVRLAQERAGEAAAEKFLQGWFEEFIPELAESIRQKRGGLPTATPRILAEAEFSFVTEDNAAKVLHDFRNVVAPIYTYAHRLLDDSALALDSPNRKALESLMNMTQPAQLLREKKQAAAVREVEHMLRTYREFASQPENIQVFRAAFEEVNEEVSYIDGIEKMLAATFQKIRQFADEDPLKAMDLHKFLDETVVTELSDEKWIRDYQTPQDTEIVTRPNKLGRVILNLIRNAKEAMQEQDREGKIYVRTRLSELGQVSQVVIGIEDEGVGIPEDKLTSIWKPDYTTKADGTGLGLASVKEIVEEDLGGTIQVRSTLGQGTIFTIEMPIRPAASEALKIFPAVPTEEKSQQDALEPSAEDQTKSAFLEAAEVFYSEIIRVMAEEELIREGRLTKTADRFRWNNPNGALRTAHQALQDENESLAMEQLEFFLELIEENLLNQEWIDRHRLWKEQAGRLKQMLSEDGEVARSEVRMTRQDRDLWKKLLQIQPVAVYPGLGSVISVQDVVRAYPDSDDRLLLNRHIAEVVDEAFGFSDEPSEVGALEMEPGSREWVFIDEKGRVRGQAYVEGIDEKLQLITLATTKSADHVTGRGQALMNAVLLQLKNEGPREITIKMFQDSLPFYENYFKQRDILVKRPAPVKAPFTYLVDFGGVSDELLTKIFRRDGTVLSAKSEVRVQGTAGENQPKPFLVSENEAEQFADDLTELYYLLAAAQGGDESLVTLPLIYELLEQLKKGLRDKKVIDEVTLSDLQQLFARQGREVLNAEEILEWMNYMRGRHAEVLSWLDLMPEPDYSDLVFTPARGDAVLILGPSMSGKSSLATALQKKDYFLGGESDTGYLVLRIPGYFLMAGAGSRLETIRARAWSNETDLNERRVQVENFGARIGLVKAVIQLSHPESYKPAGPNKTARQPKISAQWVRDLSTFSDLRDYGPVGGPVLNIKVTHGYVNAEGFRNLSNQIDAILERALGYNAEEGPFIAADSRSEVRINKDFSRKLLRVQPLSVYPGLGRVLDLEAVLAQYPGEADRSQMNLQLLKLSAAAFGFPEPEKSAALSSEPDSRRLLFIDEAGILTGMAHVVLDEPHPELKKLATLKFQDQIEGRGQILMNEILQALRKENRHTLKMMIRVSARPFYEKYFESRGIPFYQVRPFRTTLPRYRADFTNIPDDQLKRVDLSKPRPGALSEVRSLSAAIDQSLKEKAEEFVVRLLPQLSESDKKELARDLAKRTTLTGLTKGKEAFFELVPLLVVGIFILSEMALAGLAAAFFSFVLRSFGLNAASPGQFFSWTVGLAAVFVSYVGAAFYKPKFVLSAYSDRDGIELFLEGHLQEQVLKGDPRVVGYLFHEWTHQLKQEGRIQEDRIASAVQILRRYELEKKPVQEFVDHMTRDKEPAGFRGFARWFWWGASRKRTVREFKIGYDTLTKAFLNPSQTTWSRVGKADRFHIRDLSGFHGIQALLSFGSGWENYGRSVRLGGMAAALSDQKNNSDEAWDFIRLLSSDSGARADTALERLGSLPFQARSEMRVEQTPTAAVRWDAFTQYYQALRALMPRVSEKDRTVISAAAGPSVRDLYLSTGFTKAYFIDALSVSLDRFAEAKKDLAEPGSFAKHSAVTKYRERRDSQGYAEAHLFDADMEYGLLKELEDLGVAAESIEFSISEKDSKRILIHFELEGLRREIEWIQADLLQLSPSLEEELQDKADVYYQKASQELPSFYQKYLFQVSKWVKPGGLVFLNDVTSGAELVSSGEALGPVHFESAWNTEIGRAEDRVEQALGITEDSSPKFFYGWKMTLWRKKTHQAQRRSEMRGSVSGKNERIQETKILFPSAGSAEIAGWFETKLGFGGVSVEGGSLTPQDFDLPGFNPDNNPWKLEYGVREEWVREELAPVVGAIMEELSLDEKNTALRLMARHHLEKGALPQRWADMPVVDSLLFPVEPSPRLPPEMQGSHSVITFNMMPGPAEGSYYPVMIKTGDDIDLEREAVMDALFDRGGLKEFVGVVNLPGNVRGIVYRIIPAQKEVASWDVFLMEFTTSLLALTGPPSILRTKAGSVPYDLAESYKAARMTMTAIIDRYNEIYEQEKTAAGRSEVRMTEMTPDPAQTWNELHLKAVAIYMTLSDSNLIAQLNANRAVLGDRDTDVFIGIIQRVGRLNEFGEVAWEMPRRLASMILAGMTAQEILEKLEPVLKQFEMIDPFADVIFDEIDETGEVSAGTAETLARLEVLRLEQVIKGLEVLEARARDAQKADGYQTTDYVRKATGLITKVLGVVQKLKETYPEGAAIGLAMDVGDDAMLNRQMAEQHAQALAKLSGLINRLVVIGRLSGDFQKILGQKGFSGGQVSLESHPRSVSAPDGQDRMPVVETGRFLENAVIAPEILRVLLGSEGYDPDRDTYSFYTLSAAVALQYAYSVMAALKLKKGIDPSEISGELLREIDSEALNLFDLSDGNVRIMVSAVRTLISEFQARSEVRKSA